MTLAVGNRLGPYEILAPLGSGGMGEVYRARDTRLAREVAVKVLPAELSSDRERLRRFEKEARSASALNHPNIVTIYEIGSAGDVTYIAMELVGGETLRTTLLRGALTTKKLLQVAAQIAEGLARAHEAGIVHRDLKPENLMITKEGLVKILDFGVAKPTAWRSGSGEGPHSPTMTETSPGVILGTAGYMSPEQASGEPVDFRSDQFALGSILYEMATGKRAFQGRTAVDTLAAILNEQPEPIASLNAGIPVPLLWIVERCHSKEPRGRYGSTEDLSRDLATVRDRLSEATSGMSLAASRPRRRWVAGLVLGIAAAAIVGFGLTRLRPQIADPRTVRFPIHAPKETGFWGVWAFSPDGSTLAFIAAGKGPSSVWLRPMSSMEARSVRGTENADSVFWSPDGKSLGFFASGKLWRVSASGGVPVPLCDVGKDSTQIGTWGADEQILFSPETGEAIYRVSSSGGTASPFVRANRARGETQVRFPWFLPDGKHFLYMRRNADGGTLMLAGPDGAARSIFPVLSRVEYMEPGYLVFTRGQTLLAQRFDAGSGSLFGEPHSLAEGVAYRDELGLVPVRHVSQRLHRVPDSRPFSEGAPGMVRSIRKGRGGRPGRGNRRGGDRSRRTQGALLPSTERHDEPQPVDHRPRSKSRHASHRRRDRRVHRPLAPGWQVDRLHRRGRRPRAAAPAGSRHRKGHRPSARRATFRKPARSCRAASN